MKTRYSSPASSKKKNEKRKLKSEILLKEKEEKRKFSRMLNFWKTRERDEETRSGQENQKENQFHEEKKTSFIKPETSSETSCNLSQKSHRFNLKTLKTSAIYDVETKPQLQEQDSDISK